MIWVLLASYACMSYLIFRACFLLGGVSLCLSGALELHCGLFWEPGCVVQLRLDLNKAKDSAVLE